MDMVGSPWFMRGNIAPPLRYKVMGGVRWAMQREHTRCQGRLIRVLETHQRRYRWAEYVEIEDTNTKATSKG